MIKSKDAAARFSVRAIGVLALALVVWMAIIAVAFQGRNADYGALPMLIFLFWAALAAIFLPRSIFARAFGWLKRGKRIAPGAAAALFVLGLVFRLGFAALDYAPTADPRHFFDDAAALAQTGALDDPSYVGMYPFVYAYTALLAGMFHITGSGVLGVVILNTAFDALAAFLAGRLIRLMTASRRWQLLASALWWISPFNIIFCAISLPVIVVNALTLAVFASIFRLFKSIDSLKRTLIFSVAAAVALAAEDAFRPIAIITVLAVAVYYAVFLLNNRSLKLLRNCVLSVVIVAALSSAAGYGWQRAVDAATGLPANAFKQGWSVYIGSNFASSGGWNRVDSDYGTSVVSEYGGDYSKAFARLQREGIQRWKALGPVRAMALVAKKSMRLAGKNQSMIYDLPASYPYWRRHALRMHALRALCAVYWFLCLAFAAYLFIGRRRMKNLDFTGFLSILTIGLFLAFMAVEVANRYFTVFFPMFAVYAVLGLKRAHERNAA